MRTLAASLLLLCAATTGNAQIAADIARGEIAYQESRAEEAKSIFASIVSSRQQVTQAQRVTAFKYLGAYWALQSLPGARDSANSFFVAALDHDPFTELDRVIFAPDEQAAFARAKLSIFKVGIDQIRPKALDIRSSRPDSSVYTFRVVSTHTARVTADIRSVGRALEIREPLATITNMDGIRDVPWNGLINTQRADTGIYEFVLTATDGLNPSIPAIEEKQRFRIDHVHAPLEDTLSAFGNVATGATDTLQSKYSGALPYTDGAKGALLGAIAGAMPFVIFNNRESMSNWSSHWGIGVSLGAIAGIGAAWYATEHRDDARAVAENARRRNARAQFNSEVIARNRARIESTILVIRPLTSAGSGN